MFCNNSSLKYKVGTFLFFIIFFSHKNCFSSEKRDLQENKVKSIEELIDFSFPDSIDVDKLTKYIAKKLNKNFIIPIGLKKKVIIYSPQKISLNTAYQVYLDALALVGLTTIESARILKVIKSNQVHSLAPFISSDMSSNDDNIFMTQVFFLNYVAAKEIVLTIKKMFSNIYIHEIANTNNFVVVARKSLLSHLETIVGKFDIKSADNVSKFVPIYYRSSKEALNFSKKLIGAKTDFSKTLLLEDSSLNRLVLVGTLDAVNFIQEQVAKFDVLAAKNKESQRFFVRPLLFVDAKKLTINLNKILRSQASMQKKKDKEDFLISAEEQTNSIIIRSSLLFFKRINEMIKLLDIRKKQVLVQIDILEVSADSFLKTGSSIVLPNNLGSKKNSKLISTWDAGKSMILSTNESDAASEVDKQNRWNKLGQTMAPELSIAYLSGSGIKLGGLGTISSSALIKLLQGDSSVLSFVSARVFSQSNEKTLFNYGDQVLYRAEKTSKPQKENIDLNISLEMKKINRNSLDMQLEISAKLLASSGVTVIPNILTKKIKQKVSLPLNNILIISGLRTSRSSTSIKKVPILSDIPILGLIFKNSQNNFMEKQTLIFLRAYPADSSNDLRAIYKRQIRDIASSAKFNVSTKK